MRPRPIAPGLALAALCGLGGIPGCQMYQPAPIDPAAHDAAWLARTPADASVLEFARGLGGADLPGAFDPADGLDLREAEVVALVYNPELRVARLRAGVAAATAEFAGLWDDPEFSIDVLRIVEGVPDPWIISPGLSLTIPISGRLEAEKARADAGHRAVLAGVAEREWQTRVEVRRAWLEWSAARLRADETERLLGTIDAVVGSAQRLAQAGEIPRTEAVLFEIERADQRRALLRHRGEAAVGEQRLRGLMGLSPAAGVQFVPSLAVPVEAEGGSPPLERSPSLARLRAEYDEAEARLLGEVRRQFPDLVIGPQFESDQGQSRIGLVGGIPIPILNANRQGIAEGEAERALAAAAYEGERERLSGAWSQALARLALEREQFEVLEGTMAPLVDRQLADAQRLVELGEGGVIVLLESLSRAAQTRMQVIDARLGIALGQTELAAIAGPPGPPEPLELSEPSGSTFPAAIGENASSEVESHP